VCGINDPMHTCDEYLVLFAKSGMTLTLQPASQNKGGRSPLHEATASADLWRPAVRRGLVT
jgi:hypothetical protein